MNDGAVDVDAVLAEARRRVREKRASGVVGREAERALVLPLPGGAPLFTDELDEPFGPLAEALELDAEYDARSRRPLVGPLITAARRVVIGLVRWWVEAITDRQERVNRLLARGLFDLRERSAPQFEARLRRLEGEWDEYRQQLVAANLNSVYFQARFSGDEPVVRAQCERLLDVFRGCRRVLDLGSGRGTFLEVLRDAAIGGYGVDVDPRMVEIARERGLEVYEVDGLAHLRTLGQDALDGLFARHVAEHVLPGALVEILRESRRVLVPGAPIVFLTPNVGTLTVGAHTFWYDPSHLRPIPSELFRFYLEVEGFWDIDIRTFEPSPRRLSDEVPAGAARDNVRLLNDTLFGDRDYAVIGRAPRVGAP